MSYLMTTGLKVLRHPKILRQVNPFSVLRAKLIGKSPATFASALTGRCNLQAQIDYEDMIAASSFPKEFKGYESREPIFLTVRYLKPEMVVETGCGGGFTSLHILVAMRLNGRGYLHSIDSRLRYDPEYYQLAPGFPCGGLIPEELRDRWLLSMHGSMLGLTRLLNTLVKPIDLFIHDSLHTREVMEWELRTAWPYIREGGVLIAHDVWSPFYQFAKEVGRDYVVSGHFGGIRK